MKWCPCILADEPSFKFYNHIHYLFVLSQWIYTIKNPLIILAFEWCDIDGGSLIFNYHDISFHSLCSFDKSMVSYTRWNKKAFGNQGMFCSLVTIRRGLRKGLMTGGEIAGIPNDAIHLDTQWTLYSLWSVKYAGHLDAWKHQSHLH